MAILSLAEAKVALDISVTDYDAELPDYIDAAQEAVDFLCGPSEAIAVTEVKRAAGAIPLNTTPVLSVTSVTGMWVGLVSSALLWNDLDNGVINSRPLAAPLLDDVYTVVYQAGRASTPKSIKQGCRIILEHQWQLQRGTGTRGGSRLGEDTTMIPGLGYAIPNRALQQMARYLRGPAAG